MFSNSLHSTPVQLIFVLHISNCLIFEPVINREITNLPAIKIFLFLLYTFSLSCYTFLHFHAEKIWYKVIELVQYESFSKIDVLYKKSYTMLHYNGDFLYNYGAEASLQGNNNIALLCLERAKDYNASSNLHFYLGEVYTNLN